MKLAKDFDQLWTEFWDWMNKHPAGSYFFRGQADGSDIIAGIGRTPYAYDPAQEKALLSAFERGARPFIAGPMSEFEQLALAQHHGCPTRLVDWSTSPLVAAFFAVNSHPHDTDAKLYALKHADMMTLDTKTGIVSNGANVQHPLAPKDGVYLIETAQVSARIKNQRGIFTLHGDPQKKLDIPVAQQFDIPKDLRDAFQNKLMDFGIDASHIFPDIDGLCKSLDWRLKSGKLNIIA